jgi:hypothetical protein
VVAFPFQLWREHLGLASLPSPAKGWVEVWNNRADEKLINLQQDPKKPVAARQKHAAKILKWTPEVEAENYLRALGVATRDLNVRSKADKFDVETGQWEKE